MNYAKNFNTKEIKALDQAPNRNDQILNNTEGYVFKISPEQRIRRFLILGTDSNTYYQTSKELTIENANCIIEEIKKGFGIQIVNTIIDIIDKNLARKKEACIFVLVLCLTYGNNELKNYIVLNFNKIITYGTQLFQFIHTLKKLRGMGSITKKIFSNWYLDKSIQNLAYQVIKYQGRTVEEGNSKSKWSHRDILRL